MKKIIVIFFGLLILSSCSDKKMDGIWDDNIKLSTKNVELTSRIDSVTITTEGYGWWIGAVSFEDSTYACNSNKDIMLNLDSCSIIKEQFLIQKRNKKTLFVKLNENNTGKDRLMKIAFESGDYFDHVTITQTGN